jgi:O-antigen/teichoic acid export membrane protein
MAQSARRIALSSSAQIVGRIITSGIGIVTVGITTRYLGLDLYGQLTTITIFLSLFTTLTDVGTNNIAIRELAQKPEDAARIIGNVLALRAAAAIVFSLLAIIAVQFIYPGDVHTHIRLGVAILAITLLLTAVQTSLTSILSANIQNYLIVIGDSLNKLVALGLIIFTATRGYGFYGVVIAYLLGAAVSFLSDSFFALRVIKPKFDLDLPYLKYLLILALPFGMAVVLNTLYFRVDGLLLSLLKGSSEVGVYGVAYKVVELTMSFPIFFMMAVFPIMSAAAKDQQRLDTIMSRSIYFLNLMAAPVVLGVIALAHETILLIGGQEFLGAVTPMIILMIGNYFVYLNSAYGNALLATNNQKIILRVTAIALAINIGINFFSIPLAGAAGAALAVAIVEAIQLYVVRRYYQKLIGRPHAKRSQIIPLLNAALMALSIIAIKTYLIRLHLHNSIILLTCISVGVLIYAFLTLITRQLKLDELKSILGKERNPSV